MQRNLLGARTGVGLGEFMRSNVWEFWGNDSAACHIYVTEGAQLSREIRFQVGVAPGVLAVTAL